jgi:stress response protein SCP2
VRFIYLKNEEFQTNCAVLVLELKAQRWGWRYAAFVFRKNNER